MKKCKYCKRKVKARGYCDTDYTFLLRNKISFDDTKRCFKELKDRDNRNKQKIKPKFCKYCGDTSKTKGYCDKHYSYLSYYNVPFDNDELCLKILTEKYEGNVIKKCIYCGDLHHGNDFCRSCYMYLYRRNIDMKDKKLCLELLDGSYKGIQRGGNN